ncbi:MAG TPA: hypothetical protein VET87_04975 [Rubrivivax sp.]|nr:hypothetical protein [Rubrivivax sp.]
MRAGVRSIQLGSSTNLAVLAPIKPGFADAQETVTYVERLQRLLDALHASRQNMRESELVEPAFPDTIGRFGVIQAFRYAIWPTLKPLRDAQPPGPLKDPGPFYLSLNVSFDGGWEPYMRVIYRDIGALLDALFCHCEGYPGSSTASFDEYCRWVRRHELPAGLYYTDSAATPGDAHYGARIEREQRQTTPAEAADQAVAAAHVDPLAKRLQDGRKAVLDDPLNRLALPLRTLKGLYRLLPLFAGGNSGDALVLRRFAHLALREFRQLLRELPTLPLPPAAAPVLNMISKSMADELAWLTAEVPATPQLADRLSFDPALLQDTMLNRADRVSHGALAMYGVRDAAQARALIASLEPLCGAPSQDAAVRHLVAISWPGLQALGLPAHRLDRLPPEFAQGMEARSGILGDLRGNHPNHWLRPLRHGAPPGVPPRIDLGVVHVVLLLRLNDPSNPCAALHPQLLARAEALAAPGSGLKLLAVEAARSRSQADGKPARDHFGFEDGISQPTPHAVPTGADEVLPGELLLGFRNQRGDGPQPPQADDLLDHGSFLVVRKLQQRLDHLAEALQDAADPVEAKEKMLGRRRDGTPLVHGGSATDNAFDYQADPDGRMCPLQSHVRRSNPRDGRPFMPDGRRYMPRILRRGMSWGPAATEETLHSPRGVLFMAYCASIAEQFETIQGWITGANSSGVSSALADPLMGVPAHDDDQRVFRYFDDAGELQRVALGRKPLVELQWGLYLFVPSRPALTALDAVAKSAAGEQKAARQAQPAPLEQCRQWVEDPARSKALWAEIRRQPGQTLQARDYGTLVGGFAGVTQALYDKDRSWSVAGYGTRMAGSIGLNYLGQDWWTAEYKAVAPLLNPLIDAVTEEIAFDVALPFVKAVLSGMAQLPQPRPGHVPAAPPRAAIDLVSLSEKVLAQLCRSWFGLPDTGAAPRWMREGGWTEAPPAATELPRCPGSIMSSSRTIFAPHPAESVVRRARSEGPRVRAAVAKMIDAGPQGSLTQQIVRELRKAGVSAEVIALSVAGMLLGFPPTVHGNFLRTMRTWIERGTLWQQQQALAELPPASSGTAYGRARDALRRPLLDAMQDEPVPAMLWRCPVEKGAAVHDPARRVVLGVQSALADLPGPRHAYDELVFGGSRNPDSPIHGRHACPGYGMGVGVLLALLAGLFDAGTLRPTGSPVLLMLTPP